MNERNELENKAVDKTITELKTLLELIETKGYKVKTDDIVEYNLKEHLSFCIKTFNTLNIDYNKQQKEFKIYEGRNVLKDFDAIEQEVRGFFKQFTTNDKVNELLQKISWNMFEEYELRHNQKLTKILQDSKKNRLVTLYLDKVLIKTWVDKDKYCDNSWTTRHDYELKRNLIELFKHLLNIDMEFEFLKYSAKDDYFKTYDENGFTFKLFKNGKIEIKGKQNNMDKINKAIEKHFEKNEYIKLIYG